METPDPCSCPCHSKAPGSEFPRADLCYCFCSPERKRDYYIGTSDVAKALSQESAKVTFWDAACLPKPMAVATVWVEKGKLRIKMALDNVFDVEFVDAAILRPRTVHTSSASSETFRG